MDLFIRDEAGEERKADIDEVKGLLASERGVKRRLVVSVEGEEPRRIINLSAGCAVMPVEVLRKAQKQFVCWEGEGVAAAELGYRAKRFHVIMDKAESSFRKLMNVPDNYEVHFMNGGATLQFAAIPMNLLGERCVSGEPRKANYVMNGYWSLKAENEAKLVHCEVNRCNTDDTGLYLSVPDPSEWKIDKDAAYMHYTEADTRQGFEFRDFPYEVVPEGMPLVCDASASFGSRSIDISKYGVVYVAAHKNFSTSGVCYMIIRKDLINSTVCPGTPSMCNWNVFQTSPNKIFNVPVISTIWLGQLVTEWMLEKGGIPYFEDLAMRRSGLLYDLIDGSGGFYRTFVTDLKFRSRMQVVFTIRSGEGADAELVEKFIAEAEEAGWVDVRSHPLGLDSPAIRITMYNAQPFEVIMEVRRFMEAFQEKNSS